MAETPDTIFEEREEELLISGTENPTLRRTAHFLKPCVPQFNGHENELLTHYAYKTAIFSGHKKSPFKVCFKGWRFPLKEWGNWVESLLPKYQSTWKKAGIFEAIMGSVYKIPRDKKLVLGLAEKWSSITNSFVFPWGEATVTLEDVMVLGGFSVLGESVLAQIEDQESVDIRLKLIEKLKEAATPGNLNRTASGRAWLRFFMGSGSKLEHEAFLSFWLSQHVFPSKYYIVGQHVFPIAICLARGTRIALAPAILASIYRDLRLLNEEVIASAVLKKDDIMNLTLYAPFQLVQLWAWERFPVLGPKPMTFTDGPKPRPARWKNLKIVPNVNIVMALDSGRSFRWRPYVSSSDHWLLRVFEFDQDPKEELEMLARCLRVSELVGISCIEQYLPHRVSKQFGVDQDIPSPVVRCNGTPSVAWSNYSRPIRDATLFVPSKHFMAGVTVQYAKWWKNSVLSQSDAIKSHVRLPRNTARSPRRFSVENKALSLADSTPKVWFLNHKPMEVESSVSRGQEDFLESLGNHNDAEKVLELAEHLSDSPHQNASISAANSRAAENEERATPFTRQMTTTSKIPLFIRVIAENKENSPVEGLKVAAATEPPSGAQRQNMSNSAADTRVVEDFETKRPVIDPITTASETALCIKHVKDEVKSVLRSSSNSRVVEITESPTRVIDLTNEEINEAEVQVSREITGLKLETRIRRLERILHDIKKTRYPRLSKG